MNSEQYFNIVELLENDELLQALYQLKAFIGASDYQLNNEWDTINLSYRNLLSYMSKGMEDEQRFDFYCKFVRKTYALAYQTWLKSNANGNTSAFGNVCKNLEEGRLSFHNVLEQLYIADSVHTQDRERLLTDLFHCVWASPQWTDETANQMESYFFHTVITVQEKLPIVSAISLSLTNYLDEAKLRLLMQLYQNEERAIRARALVGITFALIFGEGMVHHFPNLKNAVQDLANQSELRNDIISLQAQLLTYANMEKVEKKISEEIMPTLVKDGIKEGKRLFNFEHLEDLLDEDKDIDHPAEHSDKVQQSIQEVINLHHQGVDVYYSSFRNLKSFSFFQQAANWFLPFRLSHSALKDIIKPKEGSLLSVIDDADICDSDQYSMMLMFKSIPFLHKEIFAERLDEMLGGKPVGKPKFQKDLSSETALRRLYLQDCYRFFMLYRSQYGFRSPFKEPLLLIQYSVLGEVMKNDADQLLATAHFHYEQKDWHLAYQLLSFIEQYSPLSHEDIQMKAGTLIKQKDYQSALPALHQALSLVPSSKWTIRQLAHCYRKLGDTDQAIRFYSQLIQLSPDDSSALFHYGETLFQKGDIHMALEQFYKVEYLNPDFSSAGRAIAWCKLNIGQAEQALNHYEKILQSDPKPDDYLNAGHASWAIKNIVTAMQYYRQYIHASGSSHRIFAFPSADIALLLRLGISLNEIHLVTDILNEKIES